MPEEMKRLPELSWYEVVAATEKPIDVLLRKGVPAYFKVRRDSEIVYRFYEAPTVRSAPAAATEVGESQDFPNFFDRCTSLPEAVPGSDAMPYRGFYDEAVFLRVDPAVLTEILVSGSCHTSRFVIDGYAITTPPGKSGRKLGACDPGTPFETKGSALKWFTFDLAVIIDKRHWAAASTFAPLDMPPIESLSLQFEIGVDDLFVLASDFDALKRESRQATELVSYPFDHRERMPGIYWMFQAAYAQHHQIPPLAKEDVRRWLNDHAPKKTFEYGSIRAAEKFAWPKVDRRQGGSGRGRFVLDDLDQWADRKNYEFDFISLGLSFVLAIADWWVEIVRISPNESLVTLAKKLDENGFAGLEVKDLCYLIGGSKLSKEEIGELESHLARKEKEERIAAAKKSGALC